MSIVVRFGKRAARIYRRTEEYLGEGRYRKQDIPLGSLPLTTTELPVGFPRSGAPLSPKEKAALERKFLVPAKTILERQRRAEEERALDPTRRLSEARKLIEEAALLSEHRPLRAEDLLALLSYLLASRADDALFPLRAISTVCAACAAAADSGRFGTRGESGPLKDSPVTTAWNEARLALIGQHDQSVMRALQRKRLVKTRDS